MIPYSKTQKVILSAAVAACSLFVVASIVKNHYTDKVAASQRESDALKGQVVQLVQGLNASMERERVLEMDINQAKLDLYNKTKQLNAMPKPVVRALPNGPQEVKDQLLDHGVLVECGEKNTLTVDVSRVVLEAFNKADAYTLAKNQIDALQGTLDASNDVILKQGELIAQKDKSLSFATNAMQLNEKRADVAEGMVRDLRTANKANEVKWWVKTGAAAVAGYLAGKRIR